MKLSHEDKVGLYITVIVHLAVIIIFLIAQIGLSTQKENTFVLDFTKQEELEKLEKELAFKKQVNKRLQEKLENNKSGDIRMKNIASNRGITQLKDDRNTDVDKLIADAKRLANELKNGPDLKKMSEDVVDLNKEEENKTKKDKKEQNYSGPSIVSYDLGGRKALHLDVPAYRCYGGGEVTVIITVNRQGNVISAKIMEDVSTNDNCLREFAIRAAKRSRFKADPNADPKQVGNIVYAFIAQY